MTPEELQHQELKNSINTITNQVDKVSNAVEKLSFKLDSESKLQNAPKNKFEGWGNSITIIIGILTGVAVLFTQLKQPDNVNADTEEKLSSARKNNAEALKLEKEIQESINSLRRKGTKDVQAYNELLEDKLPKLQNVITNFERARVQNQNQNLFYKYIILWVIFIGLGWFFRIFHTIWSNLINIISLSISNRIRTIRDEKKSRRLIKISNSLSFLYSFPTILEVLIDINIFFILIVPIFNETAASLGSNKDFSSISKELKEFDVGTAIDNIKSILTEDDTNKDFQH